MKTLMVILLLKLNFSKMEEKEKKEKKKDDLLTCMASPQVKIEGQGSTKREASVELRNSYFQRVSPRPLQNK